MTRSSILRCHKVNILLIFSILAACSKKTRLDTNQRLLYSIAVKGNKNIGRDEIEPFFKQRPNTKVLGVPTSLYFYNFGQKFLDTAKIERKIHHLRVKYDKLIADHALDTTTVKKLTEKQQKKIARQIKKLKRGNWWMRTLGSPPVIFDSLLTNQTVRLIDNFYQSQGYFRAKVGFQLDTLLNSLIVKYMIDEKNQYKISRFSYQIKDGALKRIINENYEDILIKGGDAFDRQAIINERDRIERLLKNEGYFNFSKKYVSFDIDTTDTQVNITGYIENPSEDELHKLYTLSSIDIIVDESSDSSDIAPRFASIDGINIRYNSDRYYSPKILRSKMQISNNDKYSLKNSQATQRYLSQLDVFKFVNLSYVPDSNNNTLRAYIFASSGNKYQVSDELGFSVSQGLPGPFGSITFTNRNLFNRCEILNIGIRGGIEGVASASNQGNIYSSTEIGANASLTFPRLLTFSSLNRIFINNNPKTRLLTSYNFIFRPEYERSNFQVALTYNLTKGNYQYYTFSLVDINYLTTRRLDPSFASYLNTLRNNGNNLYVSFYNSINPNMNLSFTYNDFLLGINKPATFFRIYAESGGTTLNFFNPDQIESIRKVLNVYSAYTYLKINVDLRKYIPVSRKSTIATRINLGVADPYNGTGMPYEKFYFTGGTNSNRAWLPRRLGPGSFSIIDSTSGRIDYRYEQPGLILIEMNAEYRFKIIKFLDGALFIDAGNVWTFNSEDQRKNIKKEFYNEIAVGSGVGVRLDFSFLIVRLDAATKIWNPGLPLAERFVAKNLSLSNPLGEQGQTLWNIAIGYPF